MLTAGKVRRLTNEKIMTLAGEDTNGPNLILCASTLRSRNEALLDKKKELLSFIDFKRTDISKVIIELKVRFG